MATLNQVCTQIKETLEAAGMRVYPYIPDNPNPPCVVLSVADSPQPLTFNQAQVEYNIDLEVYVASVADWSGQLALCTLLSQSGAGSIAQAIFNTPTLRTDPAENTAGTPTMTASWRGIRGYDPMLIVAGARYFYGIVEMQIITRGDS